jgi:hypothetical protein
MGRARRVSGFRPLGRCNTVALALVAAWLMLPATSRAVLITFENLSSGVSVTNQYAAQGVDFSNATVLTAGVSLNEMEFPPHSGTNVIYDAAAPVTVTFSTPYNDVGAYFTYATQITLNAYDAHGNLLATLLSPFSKNEAMSPGSTPDAFLGFAGVGPISSISIVGDSLGGSFVLDDLTATPEPAALLLWATGLAALVTFTARRARSAPAPHHGR